jgi:hypothetical protein
MARTFISGKGCIFNPIPKDEEEVLKSCNALAKSGYPICTDGCFHVGISGGCSPECFIYLDGKCKCPGEMVDRLDPDGKKTHLSIYGEL